MCVLCGTSVTACRPPNAIARHVFALHHHRNGIQQFQFNCKLIWRAPDAIVPCARSLAHTKEPSNGTMIIDCLSVPGSSDDAHRVITRPQSLWSVIWCGGRATAISSRAGASHQYSWTPGRFECITPEKQRALCRSHVFRFCARAFVCDEIACICSATVTPTAYEYNFATNSYPLPCVHPYARLELVLPLQQQ